MASRLFDEAKKDMLSGNLLDACQKLAESERLDPQLGTLLHLGECYDKVGRTASAWAIFRDAAEVARQRSDTREAKIRQRVAGLEAKVSNLTITVDQPELASLEVKEDGAIVGRAGWGTPIPVDPGEHEIRASATGRKAWIGKIQVAPNGAAAQIHIPILETNAAEETTVPTNPVAPPSTAPPEISNEPNQRASAPERGEHAPRPGSIQRLIGWTAVGVGGAGLVVGLVYQLQASSKLSDRDDLCPGGTCTVADSAKKSQIDSLTSDAQADATVRTIGFVAGGVLAAAGLALVFTAPDASASADSVAIVPAFGPGFHGAAIAGRVW